MIDEIIELLKEYTDRFADDSYYMRLGKILMKYNNIDQDDFNGIKFITVEEAVNKFNTDRMHFEFTKAFYYEPEEIICLLIDNIKENTKTWNYHGITNQEHYIFSNLVRSEHLFHEFEHVVQKRGKSGLEGMLTRDCITSKGFEEYAISPREHFANLYAKLIAFSIAERMNMPESVSRYYKHEVCVTLYNPYLYNKYDAKRKNKNTNEPIIEYFNKINKPIDMNLEFVNNLDFMNRIIFGFGISDVEFEYFLSICNLNGVEPNKILKQLSKYSNMDESIYKNVGNQSQTINKC